MKLICNTEITTEIADTLVSKINARKIDGVYVHITKGIYLEILVILKKKLLDITYENNKLYQFENDETGNYAHYWAYFLKDIIYLFEKQPDYIYYITDFPQNYSLEKDHMVLTQELEKMSPIKSLPETKKIKSS
jgi:hypothetical protein